MNCGLRNHSKRVGGTPHKYKLERAALETARVNPGGGGGWFVGLTRLTSPP